MCGGFSKRIARRRAPRAWCVVPDRLFAAQLYERGVPLETVENALILAAARRSARPADAPPLGIDSITGVLLAGDRGSPATEGRPGILSAPPQQTPARHSRTIAPSPSQTNTRKRACRRG